MKFVKMWVSGAKMVLNFLKICIVSTTAKKQKRPESFQFGDEATFLQNEMVEQQLQHNKIYKGTSNNFKGITIQNEVVIFWNNFLRKRHLGRI